MGPDIHLVRHDMIQMIEKNQVSGNVLQRCLSEITSIKIVYVNWSSQTTENLGFGIDFPLSVGISPAQDEFPGSFVDITFYKIGFEPDAFVFLIDVMLFFLTARPATLWWTSMSVF